MLDPTSFHRASHSFSAPWRILLLLVALALPGLAVATLAGLDPQGGAPAQSTRSAPPPELADNAPGTPAPAADTLPFLPLPEGTPPSDGSLFALPTAALFSDAEQTLPVKTSQAFDPATLPAPEPSALLLLAVGIGLLWVVRRKH